MPGNNPFKGERTRLTVGTESSQNTTVTPDRTFGIVQEDAQMPDPEINWLEERTIGDDRSLFNKVEGLNAYEGGSITTLPQDGAPLAYLMGSDTTHADSAIPSNQTTALDTGGADLTSETGTTVHQIEFLDDDIPPTQTIEAAYFAKGGGSNFVRTFGGASPNSGEISMSNEEELQVGLDYIAMSVSTGTSVTDTTPPSDEPWKFSDVQNNLNIFGTSFARVNDFSISITNNLQPGRYIEDSNAPDPFELLYNNVEFEWSATITVDDSSVYDELTGHGNDTFFSVIQFEKPGSGEALRFEGIDCNLTTGDYPMVQEGVVETDVSIIPEEVRIWVEDDSTSSSYV